MNIPNQFFSTFVKRGDVDLKPWDEHQAPSTEAQMEYFSALHKTWREHAAMLSDQQKQSICLFFFNNRTRLGTILNEIESAAIE